MNVNISVPDEYKNSFQRLIPYFPASLREDAQALGAILLYLKIGGEKLARIAIEAYKQNQRLSHAEAQKRLREAALAIDTANHLENDEDVDETENEANGNAEDLGEDEDDY